MLCATMTDSLQKEVIQRYGKVNNMILTAYGQKCLDFRYDNMIKELRQEGWSSSAGEGGEQFLSG